MPNSGARVLALRKWVRRAAVNWQLYLLILPGIASVFLFHYMPIYGVQIAFRDYRPSLGIIGSKWVGLKHFARFINYPMFWKILINTLRISLYSLAAFPLPILLALMLNEVRNQAYKKTVQMISYAPHFVSTVVVCSMLKLFLDADNGIINKLIAVLGGETKNWLTVADCFTGIYVISGVWSNIGWGTIIYIAALSGVSVELHEAARIDGASRLQILRFVNLPAILPTVIMMFILRTGSILSVGYEKAYLMQNSLNLDASQIIATYVYEIGVRGGQFSYSTAIGLFNNVTNMTVILIVNAIAKKVSNVGMF